MSPYCFIIFLLSTWYLDFESSVLNSYVSLLDCTFTLLFFFIYSLNSFAKSCPAVLAFSCIILFKSISKSIQLILSNYFLDIISYFHLSLFLLLFLKYCFHHLLSKMMSNLYLFSKFLLQHFQFLTKPCY